MFMRINITTHVLTTLFTVVLVAAQTSVTMASTPRPATGTFFPTAVGSVAVRVADGNTFLEITGQTGAWTGTIAGTTSEDIRGVIHKDGSTNFSGQLTCVCTVDGRSGTMTVHFNLSGDATGFTGNYRIITSGGGLAGLRGQGTLVSPPSFPGTYTGTYHFE
jgi:hypothetical protein